MAFKLICLWSLCSLLALARPARGEDAVDSVSESKVVGGHDAQFGEFTYLVSLQSRVPKTRGTSHYCSGSIVQETWVLTAGHCITRIPDPNVFVVKAGKYNIDRKERGEQVNVVLSSFVHPRFSGTVGPYDIGLLKLKYPFEFNAYVSTISIPRLDEDVSGLVTLAGWGSTSNLYITKHPSILQTVDVPIIDINTCNESLAEWQYPTRLSPLNVCTGPLVSGIGPCNGDSGSPLVKKDDGYKIIVGIVSWGLSPCTSKPAPSVYTRVSAFTDWITETIQTSW